MKIKESMEGTAKVKNAILKKDPKGEYEFKLRTININGNKKGCSGFIKKGNNVVYITTESTDMGLGYMYRYAKDFKDFKGHQNMWAKTFDKFIDSIIDALNKKSPFNESFNKNLFDKINHGTINILNNEETDFKRCEITGLYSDCFEIECYDFSKSKEPFWHGWVSSDIVISLMNGEPLPDYYEMDESLAKLNETLKSLLEGEVVDFVSYRNKKNGTTNFAEKPFVKRTLSQEQVNSMMQDILTDMDKEEESKELPKVEDEGKEIPAKNYKKNPADVEVGDILVREWGWSMRLVDYYRVISRTKSSIKLEHLKGKRITGDGWTGTEVPTDKVERDTKVDGKSFRIIPPEKQYYQDVNQQAVCRINGDLVEFWDGKPKNFDTLD